MIKSGKYLIHSSGIVFENLDTSAYYGAHGTFLASLIAVADVEIESRARDEWIVHRKVFDVRPLPSRLPLVLIATPSEH